MTTLLIDASVEPGGRLDARVKRATFDELLRATPLDVDVAIVTSDVDLAWQAILRCNAAVSLTVRCGEAEVEFEGRVIYVTPGYSSPLFDGNEWTVGVRLSSMRMIRGFPRVYA